MTTPSYELTTLCHAIHAALPSDIDHPIAGVSKDTRTLQSGNLYVALRGDQFDGHRFVQAALDAGASYAITDHLCGDSDASRQIIVNDTLLALQAFAKATRAAADYRVIAITGSVGKTSTKDMTRLALSNHKVYATQGNYNNHIGVPLTILNTPENTDHLVLEMGMSNAGEIALLSDIAAPDAAIITSVDAAHLESFGSIEGIAHAKAEITTGMQPGSPIALPADNAYHDILHDTATRANLRILDVGTTDHADYVLSNITVTPTHSSADYTAPDSATTAFTLPAIGTHHCMNAGLVIACLSALDIDVNDTIAQLTQYHESAGRGTTQAISWNNGTIHIIDETYNASPAAMRAAFARIAALAAPNKARTVAVLGDMLELGTQSAALHAALSRELQSHNIHHVFTVGPLSKHLHEALSSHDSHCQHFDSNAALANMLKDYINDGDYVLFKGSRGSHIEEIIAALTGNQ